MRLHEYLARIGISDALNAGVDTLRRLHVAHREAFLFENLSIQTGGGISLLLEDIERKFLDERCGGYCFEHNTLFAGTTSGARPASPSTWHASPSSLPECWP